MGKLIRTVLIIGVIIVIIVALALGGLLDAIF